MNSDYYFKQQAMSGYQRDRAQIVWYPSPQHEAEQAQQKLLNAAYAFQLANMPMAKSKLQRAQEYAAEVRKRKGWEVKRG